MATQGGGDSSESGRSESLGLSADEITFKELMEMFKKGDVSDEQEKLFLKLGLKMVTDHVRLKETDSGIPSPVKSCDEQFRDDLDRMASRPKNIWVTVDKGTLQPGPSGTYWPEQHFKDLSILGEGFSGVVKKVLDKKTAKEHAMKVMPKSARKEEIHALRDLQDQSPDIPLLYLIRDDGNNIAVHMELVQNGVVLDNVLRCIQRLETSDLKLARMFALCVLHNLLEVIKEIHEKGWSHCDIKCRNIILRQDTMKIVLIDFGCAQKLLQKEDGADGLLKQMDLEAAVTVFCTLYAAQDVASVSDEIKKSPQLDEELKRNFFYQLISSFIEHTLEKIPDMNREEKENLVRLLKLCRDACDAQTEGYATPDLMLSHIVETLCPGEIAYQFFLLALKDCGHSEPAARLRARLSGNDNIKYSAETRLVENKEFVLDLLNGLGVHALLPIEDKLKGWRVLTDDEEQAGSQDLTECFFSKLHHAVCCRNLHLRCSKVPKEIQENLKPILSQRMERIRKSVAPLLFPDFYAPGVTDGDIHPPRTEMEEPPNTDVADQPPSLSPAMPASPKPAGQMTDGAKGGEDMEREMGHMNLRQAKNGI